MSTVLIAAVLALHEARKGAAEVAADLGTRKAAFDLENRELLARAKDAKAKCEAADTALRALALEHYKATEETKPTPGVEIKMRTIYEYDEKAAFAWAQQTKLALIPEQLDKAAFEKIAKATKLDFVLSDEEPSVAIATDLGKVIEQDTSAAKEAARSAAAAAALVGEDTPF